jgi:threonine dehydratase
MALIDPVKIYAASSNLEAEMIRRRLLAAGIEAHAGEDVSTVGFSLFGTIAGVFDAGVFVSRPDAVQAMEVIREHERQQAERAGGAAVEATCEDCGKTSSFAAAQRGTVQNCPHCDAFMDVGEVELPGDPDEGIREKPAEEGAED